MPRVKNVRCPLCASKKVKLRFFTSAGDIALCQNCTLLFRSPQPSQEMLEMFYQSKYTSSRIERRKTSMASPLEVSIQIISHIERHFGSLKGKSVLDYGCSLGDFGILAKEKGAKVAGIELDDSARYEAKNNGIDVFKDLRELKSSETEKKFDIITMIQVIEHLRKPWLELEELSKLLYKDGIMFISTPNARSLNARITRGRWREMQKPGHLYWFTYASIKQVCEKAGLNDVLRVHWRITHTKYGYMRRCFHRLLQVLRLSGIMIIARKTEIETIN